MVSYDDKIVRRLVRQGVIEWRIPVADGVAHHGVIDVTQQRSADIERTFEQPLGGQHVVKQSSCATGSAQMPQQFDNLGAVIAARHAFANFGFPLPVALQLFCLFSLLFFQPLQNHWRLGCLGRFAPRFGFAHAPVRLCHHRLAKGFKQVGLVHRKAPTLRKKSKASS